MNSSSSVRPRREIGKDHSINYTATRTLTVSDVHLNTDRRTDEDRGCKFRTGAHSNHVQNEKYKIQIVSDPSDKGLNLADYIAELFTPSRVTRLNNITLFFLETLKCFDMVIKSLLLNIT